MNFHRLLFFIAFVFLFSTSAIAQRIYAGTFTCISVQDSADTKASILRIVADTTVITPDTSSASGFISSIGSNGVRMVHPMAINYCANNLWGKQEFECLPLVFVGSTIIFYFKQAYLNCRQTLKIHDKTFKLCSIRFTGIICETPAAMVDGQPIEPGFTPVDLLKCEVINPFEIIKIERD